ncbi:hypothetical protein GF352_01485 [archaeon]|nr:hypothetical protein [archaeon]
MSYLEDAVYQFIKNTLTRGIIVLTNKRFLLYTSIAVIIPVILTVFSFIQGVEEVTAVSNMLVRLELVVCVALVITGLISLKTQLIKIEHLFFITLTGILFSLSFVITEFIGMIETVFMFVGFYSWIITTNLSALMAIREFMVSWPGWVLRLGDKPHTLTFGLLIKIGVIISLGWFIYTLIIDFSWTFLLAFFCGLVILYTIYIFLPLTHDANMTGILSFFYFSLLYHLLVRAESLTGFILFDTILIVISTIFTAQSISRLIASKQYALPYHWDSLIILLMGFMLGYHLLGMRIALTGGFGFLYSTYHNISFGFGTLIIFGALLLYLSNPKFKRFSKPKITVGTVVKKVGGASLDAIADYAKHLKNKLKKKEWTFEIKKEDREEDDFI